MASGFEVLKNAILMDTETLGLQRGSGIHELAVYNLESRILTEYLPEPQIVFAQDLNRLQETTRLASSSRDYHKVVPGVRSWKDAITKYTNMQTNSNLTDWNQVMSNLKRSNPFLHKALAENKYPHLVGRADDLQARSARLRRAGVHGMRLGQRATLEELFSPNSGLMKEIAGKTIWMANANFDSKQIGAQLDAMIRGGNKELAFLKNSMESHNPGINDPLYVSGVEVNNARSLAQVTGDWTKVWESYQQNIPKAGETAVRDIQDVTRAFASYGKKLGLLDESMPQLGNSVDTTYRLFGSLEDDPVQAAAKFGMTEVHRAAEDVALSESYVLENAVRYTTALQEVSNNTPTGRQLVLDAAQGKGDYYKATQYFKRLEQLAPILQEQNAVSRLARAQEDIVKQGYTAQVVGTVGNRKISHVDSSGRSAQVTIPNYQRESMSTMREVVDYLKQGKRYGAVDLDLMLEDLTSSTSGAQEPLGAISDWARKRTAAGSVEQFINNNMKVLMEPKANIPAKVAQKALNNRAGNVVVGALALGAAYMASPTANPTSQDRRSIATFNYNEWMASQRMEGMQERGINARQRKQVTDFGSPYQGPMGSFSVLAEQDLLDQREKWLREEYGARHFDPDTGLFGRFSVFKGLGGRAGYNYIQAGRSRYHNGDDGLRGKLTHLDVSGGNWKITADDADTVTIKRGGIRGGIASMFGLNRGYSFRLAGVDSTETDHGGKSYRGAQPYADAAAEALRSMIKGSKQLELVYDPGQTTYGRMMGVVIADGQNLNFEIVKRGIAAHLPFGNPQDSMIDYKRMSSMEKQAYQAKRGLWSQPWAQAFYDFSEASGNRVTFNTLASKEKVAKNSVLMSQLSLMNQAQANGMYHAADRIDAAQMGNQYAFGSDYVSPQIFGLSSAPHNNYMERMLQETSDFVKTKGTGRQKNKLSHRNGYKTLNKTLTLDTMGSTTTIWNKRNLQSYDSYGTERVRKRQRKQNQAAEQRRINDMFSQSYVNHHRMQ